MRYRERPETQRDPLISKRLLSLGRAVVLASALSSGCSDSGESEPGPSVSASPRDGVESSDVAAKPSSCLGTTLLGDCESGMNELGTTRSGAAPLFRSDMPTAQQYPDVILDAVESTSGWSGTTLDSANFKSGRASLTRTSSTARFYRTFSTPIDASNMRFLSFWYYIDDPTKVVNTDQQVEIGSAGTYDQQERSWNISDQSLQRGWNHIVLHIPTARHRTAADGVQANLSRINWFRIYQHPSATVTTKIDQIVFTNRVPQSLAFSLFIDRKEALLRHPDGAGLRESASLATILRLSATSTRRKQECRGLTLERQRRSVSQVYFDALGIGADLVTALQKVEAYVCNQQAIPSGSFDATVNLAAKNYVVAEADMVSKVAARFGASALTASETAKKMLEFDNSRIKASCGTVESEVASFIETGVNPTGIVGPNALFRNCRVSSLNNLGSEVAVTVGGGRSLTGAGDRYRSCMDAFTSQASECSNPYASPVDEFEDQLRHIQGYKDNPEKRNTAVDHLYDKLAMVRELNLDEANDIIDQHNDVVGFEDIRNVAPTQPNPDQSPNEALWNMHEAYDDKRSQAEILRQLEQSALGHAEGYVPTDPAAAEANLALAEAYHRAAAEAENEAARIRDDICREDPDDPVCKGAPPPPPRNGEDEPLDPNLNSRCAEMNVGGDSFWYETARTSGKTHEVNSMDRINHCLCEVFDRQYPDLPQFQIIQGVNVNAFCPSPEERVMHECTQPGWDDGPPSPICLKGLVSDSVDYSGLTSRLCDAMKSTRCPDPALQANGECNCFTLEAGGTIPTRRCNQQINCGPDAIPDDQTCGCRRMDAPRVCAGNVLTQMRPVVTTFPTVTALANKQLLSVATDMPIVSRAVTRSLLTSGNAFGFSVYNPNDGGAMTATADLRCTSLERGVSNYLVERVSLSNVGSGVLTNANVTFSSVDLDQCFGTNRLGSSNFEVSLKTSRTVPRISYVADRNFAGILDPIFPAQPCTIPTIGPIPRPTWNMSTGQVLRNDFDIAYPRMLASGIIAAPATVVDSTFYRKDYAPSSLALLDRNTVAAATTSQLAVDREGTVDTVTLALSFRGNSNPGRFSIALVAPNGSVVHEVTGLKGDGELFDGGIVVDPSTAIDSEGTWTLRVRDLGGTNGGAKTGDLYSWSLNFNLTDEWEDKSLPTAWSCDGHDGFEEYTGEFYGDGDCDCGCGAMDIDCAQNAVSECDYDFCHGEASVNPDDIATCE